MVFVFFFWGVLGEKKGWTMSIKSSVGVWQTQRQISVRGDMVKSFEFPGMVQLSEDIVCCGCKPSGQVTGLLFGLCWISYSGLSEHLNKTCKSQLGDSARQ